MGILCTNSLADIEIEGTALALASTSGEEDRNTIDLSSAGTSAGSVGSVFGEASSSVTVELESTSTQTTISVDYALDTGTILVGSGSTDGQFEFTVPDDTEFSITGYLETITTIPSTGGVVQIRNQANGAMRYQATPNFTLPNRPTDFDAIPSSGLLRAGTYELSWVHITNYNFVTAPSIGTGSFTLTLSIPGCNPADFTSDGVLDFFDVSAFLDAFASMDPSADLTDDGVFDFFDVSDFLDAFSTGCP